MNMRLLRVGRPSDEGQEQSVLAGLHRGLLLRSRMVVAEQVEDAVDE